MSPYIEDTIQYKGWSVQNDAGKEMKWVWWRRMAACLSSNYRSELHNFQNHLNTKSLGK